MPHFFEAFEAGEIELRALTSDFDRSGDVGAAWASRFPICYVLQLRQLSLWYARFFVSILNSSLLC